MIPVLVVRTLPDFCPVCEGDGEVLMARPSIPRLTAPIPCPHCSPYSGQSIPILMTMGEKK